MMKNLFIFFIAGRSPVNSIVFTKFLFVSPLSAKLFKTKNLELITGGYLLKCRGCMTGC